MLVVDIGIANVVVNVLVEFSVVAVPDKFALMLIVLVFDIGFQMQGIATRRRRLIPGKPRQRIHKPRRSRFEVFNKCRLVLARIRIMAASGKFRFDTPIRRYGRIDARDSPNP